MADRSGETPGGDAASVLRGATAGLIAGMVASFAMDRFQAAVAALSSPADGGDPATDKTANAISRALVGHELAEPAKVFGGQLVHYGLGAGLGLTYGIAAEYRRVVVKGYGTAFGVGVAAVLDEAIVPALDLAEPPWRTDIGTHMFSLASHLVFGVVAEFTRRQIRATF